MVEYSFKKALNKRDLKILELIQGNAAITNVELARLVNLSPSATHGRVKRLEEEGYIERRLTVLSRDQRGFDMLCLILIRLKTHQIEQIKEFYESIEHLEEVLECYHITGEHDYVLKVAQRNHIELRTFVLEQLTPLPYIATVLTSLVLEEVKFTTALPLTTAKRAVKKE
mgnify:CR=1 FL=1